MPSLASIRRQIITCERCPRLRAYCARIARQKRAAFRDQTYWGRPVPGFGDPRARLLVIGLAPAAHGGNRTGRLFTGDSSGDFLMAAMHRTGFASQPSSRSVDDGLKLTEAYIAAVVRCAPPENKPTPKEIDNCHAYLHGELEQLTRVTAVVALGRLAFDGYWRLMKERGIRITPRPRFAHGLVYAPPGAPALVASYHPSQQNTFTGRLTEAMLVDVFRKARKLIER